MVLILRYGYFVELFLSIHFYICYVIIFLTVLALFIREGKEGREIYYYYYYLLPEIIQLSNA